MSETKEIKVKIQMNYFLWVYSNRSTLQREIEVPSELVFETLKDPENKEYLKDLILEEFKRTASKERKPGSFEDLKIDRVVFAIRTSFPGKINLGGELKWETSTDKHHRVERLEFEREISPEEYNFDLFENQ